LVDLWTSSSACEKSHLCYHIGSLHGFGLKQLLEMADRRFPLLAKIKGISSPEQIPWKRRILQHA
jgi:hypothetical protein